MNATQAMTQLRTLLGKNAVLRDSKRPSSPEMREQQHAKHRAVSERKKIAAAALDARRAEILAADSEYQRLLAEYESVRAEKERTPMGLHCRYSAGRDHSFFFLVDAEADTLAELVAKVREKKAAA